MKIGDVVYLKSGSPRMTISDIREERVWVHWIGLDNEAHLAVFPEVCLTTERPPE